MLRIITHERARDLNGWDMYNQTSTTYATAKRHTYTQENEDFSHGKLKTPTRYIRTNMYLPSSKEEMVYTNLIWADFLGNFIPSTSLSFLTFSFNFESCLLCYLPALGPNTLSLDHEGCLFWPKGTYTFIYRDRCRSASLNYTTSTRRDKLIRKSCKWKSFCFNSKYHVT